MTWPVAVVAESADDRSVAFRTYCSQWPVDGRRHVRAPILEPGPDAEPGDVVGRYLAALDAGDRDAIVRTFAPDGYLREPIGPRRRPPRHRRAPRVLRRVLQRRRRHRPRALPRDRRRRAVRAGVQLRPLGRPRPAARRRASRCSSAAPDGLLAAARGLRRRGSPRRRSRRARAMSSDAIAEYALLSDRHSAALVQPRRLDRLVVLPAVRQPVDLRPVAGRAGRLTGRCARRAPSAVTRRYLDRTMVLETTYRTATGTAVVVDALAMGEGNRGHDLGRDAPHLLLRQVTCSQGEVEMERGVRPATRVRTRGPVARRGRRGTASPPAAPTSWSCRVPCP